MRTIVVAGLPRCGSSLTMAMLEAGGVPVVGRFPDYEEPQSGAQDFDPSWFGRIDGRAVKVLDPQVKAGRYFNAERHIVILLTRNAVQQAASQIKFLRHAGLLETATVVGRHQRRAWAALCEKDTALMMSAVKRSGCVYVPVRFEKIITDPATTARLLADALASDFPGLDQAAMAARVVPRSPDCLPHLLEAKLLEEVR